MEITVVIPHRVGSDCKLTLDTLANQTFKDFEIVLSEDTEKKGASWARNRGFERVKTPFVLFSDDDIEWESHALETLYNTLLGTEHSYSYGSYRLVRPGDVFVQCDKPFDPNELRRMNYISTMSLIRSSDFSGFDESLRRFQDWDLWLSMLREGKTGIYCGRNIFTTYLKDGISHNGDAPLYESMQIVLNKYR